MDSPKSSQLSSLDSLRTVEFRQTLRGYHIDDVDEYLERVAVDAETLQEQLRQSNERTKQAAERIGQLEGLLAERPEQPTPAESEPRPSVGDDTLQRTLVMAQKFVDQTKSESEALARTTVSKAEEQARRLVTDAEARARSVGEEAQRQMREDIGRLESLRTQLADEVETIARHLDEERSQLRSSLVEMLRWVDKQVQPSPSVAVESEDKRGGAGASGQPASSSNGPNSQVAPRDMSRTPTGQPTLGGR